MPRKALIIAFRFPPFSRVGAYRWARLAPRLADLGHELHVMTVRWPEMDAMEWLSEVIHPRIRIHRTRSGFPQYLRYVSFPAPFNKYPGKLIRGITRLVPAYDEARYWGRHLLPAAEAIIRREAIDRVIATGPPFTAQYWASQLKQRHPRLKLIQDFRDPWFVSREELRLSRWRSWYEAAIRVANLVVAVTPEMARLVQDLSDDPVEAMCIPNGIDHEAISSVPEPERKQIDLLYAGSSHDERSIPLGVCFRWMRRRRAEGRPVSLELIGYHGRAVVRDAADLVQQGDVVLRDALPQHLVFARTREARRALQLNAPGKNLTQVSTKLMEHAGLGVPTVSINYGGAVDRLIREERLGWSIPGDAPDVLERLDAMLEDERTWSFDTSEYDFRRLARRYSEAIDSLAD